MAQKLAVALVDAFDPRARGCFVPDGNHDQSYKAASTVRLDYQLNSNGETYIAICPSAFNDVSQFFIQDASQSSSYLSMSVPDLSYVPPGSGYGGPMYDYGGICANGLPFSAWQGFALNQGTNNSMQSAINQSYVSVPYVRTRVVTAQLKFTFTGSSLNDGGVAYSLTEPNHNTLEYTNLNNYYAQFTSTKSQPMTLRDEMEVTVFPVNDAMRDFSPYVDDVLVNNQNGLTFVGGTNNIQGALVGALPPCNGLDLGAPGTLISKWDPILILRKVASTLRPLSRLDSPIAQIKVAEDVTIQIDQNGQVTGLPLNPSYSGCFALYNAPTDLGPKVYTKVIFVYIPQTSAWYAYSEAGGLFNASDGVFTSDIYMYGHQPSAIAVLYVNAGANSANQPFHIEYTVHVEYTGLGSQNKTTVNPPDHHFAQAVFSAARRARDICGQHRHLSLRHAFKHALREIGRGLHHSAVAALETAVDQVPGAQSINHFKHLIR